MLAPHPGTELHILQTLLLQPSMCLLLEELQGGEMLIAVLSTFLCLSALLSLKDAVLIVQRFWSEQMLWEKAEGQSLLGCAHGGIRASISVVCDLTSEKLLSELEMFSHVQNDLWDGRNAVEGESFSPAWHDVSASLGWDAVLTLQSSTLAAGF